MTRRYLADLEQENEVVEKGRYTVEVVDARSAETSSGGDMLWLDLKIIGSGPDDGRVVSTSINLPLDGEKGVFYLRKKMRGWQPQISAARVSELPDEDQPDAICAAILGTQVDAELSQQTEGQYKGSQQLDETFQTEASKNVAPPTLQAAPAPAPENNGAPVQQPVSVNTDPPF